MRNKVKAKNDSGITLVALIITIIILVILAAVTVKTLFNDKLVETAIKAGEDYKAAQGHEMNELGRIDNELKDGIKGIGSGEASKPSGIVGAISFGELTWNSGKASVVVTKNSEDGYTIEYKVTNKNNIVTREYAPIASGETITDLNLGDLVTARLTDGTNHSKPADLNVEDKNKPQVTLKLKEGVTAKGKKAIVVATVVENESGVASYKFEYKLSTADKYNSDTNGTITTSEKTQEYEYTNLTEQVVNNLRVLVTDNAGNSGTITLDVTPEKEGMSAEDLNTETHPELVGKEITGYTPTGSSYSVYQDGLDRSGKEDKSESAAQKHTRDTSLTWKLWKVDTAKNEIQIITNKGAATKLQLNTIMGFQNGVKLLDEICSNVYGNSTIAAKGGSYKARNMKLSDIIGTDGSDKTIIKVNNQNTVYGNQPYSYSSMPFPDIWYLNDRLTNSITNREIGGDRWLSASDAKQGSSGSKPYESRWYNTSMSSGAFTQAAYYNMVMGEALGNGGYWLSTRCADFNNKDHCWFGLELVNLNGIDGYDLYYLDGSWYSKSSYAVRPLVTIPLSSVTVEETADGKINLSY